MFLLMGYTEYAILVADVLREERRPLASGVLFMHTDMFVLLCRSTVFWVWQDRWGQMKLIFLPIEQRASSTRALPCVASSLCGLSGS